MPFRVRSRRRAATEVSALAFALLVSFVLPSPAQTPAPAPADSVVATETLTGRVVREGQPVPGAAVILHRVTPQASGEIDSAETDQAGTFRFELPQLGDAAFNVFFVTAQYRGVRYFGPPIHIDEAAAPYSVEVFDTTSSLAQPVRISRRDLVLLPQANDSWEVNDLITLLNLGSRALVAETGVPTLQIPLAQGAADFQAGQADVLPHEVAFMDGEVLVLTPVIPGQRELLMRYRLPALPADVTLPVGLPTDTFNLYVQQPSHLTSVEGLATGQMISVEGEQFLQYLATDLQPDHRIALEWTGGPPFDPVIAAVAVTVVLLAAGAWVAIRNRSPAAA